MIFFRKLFVTTVSGYGHHGNKTGNVACQQQQQQQQQLPLLLSSSAWNLWFEPAHSCPVSVIQPSSRLLCTVGPHSILLCHQGGDRLAKGARPLFALSAVPGSGAWIRAVANGEENTERRRHLLSYYALVHRKLS